MLPEQFPGCGPDGEEPDGSAPRPARGNEPEDAAGFAGETGPEQGLFVCLPAENLDVSRFAQHGASDVMPPGPLLASVVHALAGDQGDGLAALSDDQLVGIIAATRRLESRIAWTQLAALAEFAADELAGELRLTWQSAAG